MSAGLDRLEEVGSLVYAEERKRPVVPSPRHMRKRARARAQLRERVAFGVLVAAVIASLVLTAVSIVWLAAV